ncbi:hypothetical protein ACG3QR_33520, partial [Pseudomonas aeruginosa]
YWYSVLGRIYPITRLIEETSASKERACFLTFLLLLDQQKSTSTFWTRMKWFYLSKQLRNFVLELLIEARYN